MEKIKSKYNQRKRGVSKPTIFRVLYDNSITPRQTTLEMIQDVLKPYGTYDKSIYVDEIIDLRALGYISDGREIEKKQNNYCFLCDGSLYSEVDKNHAEICLTSSLKYEGSSDIYYERKKLSKIRVIVCADCHKYLVRLDGLTYVDIINKVFPAYEFSSQQSIAEYLNTNQPTVSRLKHGKVELIDEFIAAKLYKRAVAWLKERELNTSSDSDRVLNHLDECKRAINFIINSMIEKNRIPSHAIETKYNRCRVNDLLQLYEVSAKQSYSSLSGIALNFDFIVRDKSHAIYTVGFLVKDWSVIEKFQSSEINNFLLKAMLVKANYLILFSLDYESKVMVYCVEYSPYLNVYEAYHSVTDIPNPFDQDDMFQ